MAQAIYIVISCVFFFASIFVMIDDDRDKANSLYPPEEGYSFRDENGKFRISQSAWVFMLATAPYTNMIVIPLLIFLLIFVKNKEKE